MKKFEREIERKVEHGASRAAATVVSAITAGGTASKARTVLNSGMVLAAGLASYYATTWLLNQVKRTKAEDLADLNLAAANAYRSARQEMVTKLGLTSWADVPPAVQSELKRQFDAALARNAAFINLKRTAGTQNIADYQRQLGR